MAKRKAARTTKTTRSTKTAKSTKASKRVAAKTTRPLKKAAKKKGPARPVRTAVKGALAGAVAVVTKRMPGQPDAIALLESDHRRIEDLLKKGEETTERAVEGRRELLDTITAELIAHEMIEEKILYPALKAHPEGRDLALEGFQEHHVADLLVKELHAVAKNAEEWGAKFKVLKENLEHHIQEEEGPMFRTARGVFSRAELQAMAAAMRTMKARARK